MYETLVWSPSAQTRTLRGRSRAASGAASITVVPATGLPKITRVVGRRSSPTLRASADWSMTSKSFIPRPAISSVSLTTVSSIERGLCFVVIPAVIVGPVEVMWELLGWGDGSHCFAWDTMTQLAFRGSPPNNRWGHEPGQLHCPDIRAPPRYSESG